MIGELTLYVQDDLMAEGKSMIGVIEGDSVPRVFIPQLVAYYKEGRFPFDKLVQFYEFDQIEGVRGLDRKSTRLNSSHVAISYAVFCLKKKITEASGTD